MSVNKSNKTDINGVLLDSGLSEKLPNLEPKKLTKWKNEPTFSNLKSDLDMASPLHDKEVAKIEEYQLYMDGGPAIASRKKKSKARPLLIRKQAEWKYPGLAEPFVNTQDVFKVNPRTGEDAAAAESNQGVLNYFWNIKVPKVALVDEIVRGIVDDGSVIVKTGWSTKTKKKKKKEVRPVMADGITSFKLIKEGMANGSIDEAEGQAMLQTGELVQIGTEEIEIEYLETVENCPKYDVKDIADVYIDPTCKGDLSNAMFVIDTYEVSKSEILDNRYINDEFGERGYYKNLESVKWDSGTGNDYRSYKDANESNSAVFADKARKKVKVYEYWGYWDINGTGELESIVCTWIGDVIIRMQKNPYAHNRIPFSMGKYMPRNKEVFGEPDGKLIKENQISIGKMTRAAHDITSTQAIGQKLTPQGFFTNKSEMDAFNRGDDAKYNPNFDPARHIYKENVEPVSPSVFQMIDMQSKDAEGLSAVKAYQSGIGGQALGVSATGIRSALDAVSKREMSILRRLSSVFEDMARMTVMNQQEFLDEETVFRITNKDVVVRREDLKGEFDLVVSVSTPEIENEKADKLNMLMQTNQANMDPGMQKIMYAKIANLWKMPDLAEAALNYKPEPDPVQQQLAQIQLENAQLTNEKLKKEIEELDAKMRERDSRAEENIKYDSIRKKAQADKDIALAEKYRSEADKLDYDLLMDGNGENRQRQVNDLEFRENTKIAIAQMKEDAKRRQIDEQSVRKQSEEYDKIIKDSTDSGTYGSVDPSVTN